MKENNTIVAIGQRIRHFRKEKGISQTELAEKIGKSLRTVQKYEKGEIEIPISVLIVTADVLNVPPADILGYDDCLPCYDYLTLLMKIENLQAKIEQISLEQNIKLLEMAIKLLKKEIAEKAD